MEVLIGPKHHKQSKFAKPIIAIDAFLQPIVVMLSIDWSINDKKRCNILWGPIQNYLSKQSNLEYQSINKMSSLSWKHNKLELYMVYKLQKGCGWVEKER